MAENKELSLEGRAKNLGIWISGEIDKATESNQYKCPEGYDYATELQSALIYIANNVKGKGGLPALEVCTKQSVYQALREMCIMGLSLTNKQVYPIVYGDKLSLQVSYFGIIATLHRILPDIDVYANVLHEGDEYDLEYDSYHACYVIKDVRTSIENLDNPIVAAYAIITNKTRKEIVGSAVMTMKQIEKSWAQSRSESKTVHKNFPEEMAKRTVLKRAIKMFLNTVDVTTIKSRDVLNSYQKVSDEEYEPTIEVEAEPMDEHRATLIAGKSKGSKGLEALVKPQEEAKTKAIEEMATPDEPVVAEEEGNDVDYDSIPF